MTVVRKGGIAIHDYFGSFFLSPSTYILAVPRPRCDITLEHRAINSSWYITLHRRSGLPSLGGYFLGSTRVYLGRFTVERLEMCTASVGEQSVDYKTVHDAMSWQLISWPRVTVELYA